MDLTIWEGKEKKEVVSISPTQLEIYGLFSGEVALINFARAGFPSLNEFQIVLSKNEAVQLKAELERIIKGFDL